MDDNNKLSFPEDDDLTALRLAALQSLKKKASSDPQMFSYNGSPRGKLKRGKFSRSQTGRSPRNGQFNGWTRNSNLITVPVVQEEENVTKTAPQEAPKLILPQDRYCNVGKSEEKSSDGRASKFDRYNNSDESESESEDETVRSETDEKPLTRSDSLEELMAELETEIQKGDEKLPEEKPKPKPKKRRKVSVELESAKSSENILKENLKPENRPTVYMQRQQRKWRRPPGQSYVRHAVQLQHEIMQAPVLPPFQPPPVQNFPVQMFYDNTLYVAPPVVYEAPPIPQLPPLHVPPPNVYERRMSPLSVNTDAFSTLAPLSPRSAAFVLENRAIIEKRKRRSYSRSPTPPRFRRSHTPPPKRLSPSPKRRSLSPSPVRKVLPPSKKPTSIHERLGSKEDDKKKERKPKEEKKQEGVDPVLEARRRKFERNEITMTEGVIRLKKEGEEMKKESRIEEEAEEEVDEDALLDGDDTLVLDHKMDALFSDEESDSDNEGRFKTKQDTNLKVAVLPFTKLINGAKSEVKSNLQPEQKKKERKGEKRKRYRSRTPVKKSEKNKQPILLAGDARRIEIKIRNPAKYERAEEKLEVKKVASEESVVDVASETPGDVSTTSNSEGDLRAQLSRKRAERQKQPLPEVVPTRFLKNALQGVAFRKNKKAKKVESAEGKLPIRLRLGTTTTTTTVGSAEAAPAKKARKPKNKGSQEQVLCSVASFLSLFLVCC